MGNLFSKFGWPSREHVGEDILLSLLDGELSITQTRRVQKHLERCWTCRARRDELAKTIGRFVGYRKQILAPHMPPPPRGREVFLAKLDEMIAARKQPWWTHPVQTLRQFIPNTMSPIFASVLVICAAAVLLIFIWQRNLPPVSASEFLEKAHVWDTQAAPVMRSGVVYQKVEICTKTKKWQHAIYRDVSGKRKARPVTLDSSEAAIRQQVKMAGIDWQEPLSVADFEDWRNRQPTFSDKVTRSGNSLLTLTTSAPSGPVASESLTVRAADFHPVERTVEMRDDDHIEIAELNYAVLGWNEVNEGLFEPLGGGTSSAVAAIHVPSLPTVEQLDLAELQARLVLNHLNADSTEELEFSRSQTAVQVKGIVESTQRKNELVAELRQVPHVAPSIFSIEELNARKDAQSGISSVKAYSAIGQPSPLEQFFKEHGKDENAVSQVSQQLLDASASVKQESNAIQDLIQRFASDSNLGDSGKSALADLLNRHFAKLLTALAAEDTLIGNNLIGSEVNHQTGPTTDDSPAALAASGERNMDLCREFISSDGRVSPRSAEVIASDLFASTQQIRTILHSLSSGKAFSQVPPTKSDNR